NMSPIYTIITLSLHDSLPICSIVVLAPGLCHYVYCLPEFDHLPAELVSHTSNHSTFESFAGKRVVVIGGGQSSLETAALAHESRSEEHTSELQSPYDIVCRLL